MSELALIPSANIQQPQNPPRHQPHPGRCRPRIKFTFGSSSVVTQRVDASERHEKNMSTPSSSPSLRPRPGSLRLRARFVAVAVAVFPALWFSPIAAFAAIDREALVIRHNVSVNRIDHESPLTVGNGDFAFTADVTGLQSFETLYHQDGIPLETLSTWGWHSFPNADRLKLEDAMAPSDFHGRKVPYASLQDSPAGKYFRENPHPIPLGQISLIYRGQPLAPESLGAIDQKLDLWTGVIRSTYTLAGQPVVVETTAHPTQSLVAVRLQSPLIKTGDLQVRFRFAYSHDVSIKNKPPLVWNRPDRHRTEISRHGVKFAQLARTIDDSRYFANVQWQGAAALTAAGAHDFHLAAKEADTLAFTCGFSPDSAAITWPGFEDARTAGVQGWKDYWTKGAVIDFSGSTDPRASELERRIVLSQYLMRVNYAGSVPPAESGLTHLSWYGKHNSEMYFWHAAQFYEWGHVDLLEKGLSWYRKILPSALKDAIAQGFAGARWPKMAGIDGRQGPGTINPFIIWNQPNPIYLSELVYRAHHDRATLEKYRDVVFESANFLASFAWFDAATDRYVLGPPIKNVSESTGENDTKNPTFELAYWYYGLSVAQQWRERLGLKPDPKWADILQKLSRLPVADGKYLEMETTPNIYQRAGGLPTTMLLALGFLPPTPMVDVEAMRRTFDEVNRRSRNGIGRWVSWSQGQGAMTAARLGQTDNALGIILNPTARFMPNGHVRRPAEPLDCPAFLPVNASLLAAAGLMAGGWDGAPPGDAPGFPKNDQWKVRCEGFNRMP